MTSYDNRVDQEGRDDSGPLLQVEDLVVRYPTADGPSVQAVSNVSFTVNPGEIVSIVGESGCGKSSLGRAVLQIPPPTSGRVVLDGTELTALSASRRRLMRPHMQMILQDPRASLNPRRKVADIVAEGLRIWPLDDRSEMKSRVFSALTAVGLEPDTYANRRAGQLSGGQCQRVAIARALALRPKLLICDEAVSALDVTVKAQVVNLLAEMREQFNLTMLFITHDLGVAASLGDRVLVMYLGEVVEEGPARQVLDSPMHPYTRSLVDSVLSPDPRAVLSAHAPIGEPASPIDPPSGCRFHPRCRRAQDVCSQVAPVPELGTDHRAACYFPLEVVTAGVEPSGPARP